LSSSLLLDINMSIYLDSKQRHIFLLLLYRKNLVFGGHNTYFPKSSAGLNLLNSIFTPPDYFIAVPVGIQQADCARFWNSSLKKGKL